LIKNRKRQTQYLIKYNILRSIKQKRQSKYCEKYVKDQQKFTKGDIVTWPKN